MLAGTRHGHYFSKEAAFGPETEGHKQQKRNTFLAFLFQILSGLGRPLAQRPKIGRASCRERV